MVCEELTASAETATPNYQDVGDEELQYHRVMLNPIAADSDVLPAVDMQSMSAELREMKNEVAARLESRQESALAADAVAAFSGRVAREESADIRSARTSEETIPEAHAKSLAAIESKVSQRSNEEEYRRLEALKEELAQRERKLASREESVAEREAHVAAREIRQADREEEQRREFQQRQNEIRADAEVVRIGSEDLQKRHEEIDCRSADLDQREARLREEEERCKELKRQLDERELRWQEATKDANVLKGHLAKPRLSPRGGKENNELQRQLEEQRGLVHKIKRKNGSWSPEDGLPPDREERPHRDSWGSEATVPGPGF